MAVLSREEMVAALERMGQMALAEGYTLRLTVIGGLR